jgi:hypothetical protein
MVRESPCAKYFVFSVDPRMMAPTLMPPDDAVGPLTKCMGANATTTNGNFVQETTSDLQRKREKDGRGVQLYVQRQHVAGPGQD